MKVLQTGFSVYITSPSYWTTSHKPKTCHVLVYNYHLGNILKQVLVHGLFITWPGMEWTLILIISHLTLVSQVSGVATPRHTRACAHVKFAGARVKIMSKAKVKD